MKINILIIYPHGNALNPHSGGETRIWNIISSLVKNNFNVSVLHSIKSKGLEDFELKKNSSVYYYRDFNIFGLKDWYFSDLNPFFLIQILKIIRKNKIDIIQLEFPWGFLITNLLKKKKTLIIYDSLGIESEFMKIAVDHPNFPKFLKNIAIIYARIYEKMVCKLANMIINVSEIDRNYYIENYNIERRKTFLVQIPSSIKRPDSFSKEDLKIECRKKLGLPLNKTMVIFHGGLPHPPNQEAFNLIKSYIAPKFVNNEILFILAGNNVKKFKEKNIISLGFVTDLKELLYSADFAIVPIVSGSGMRVKCADYITAGLPFITTKKGIEGLEFLEEGKDCLIFDSVNADFIDGIKLLNQDKNLLKKMNKNLLKKSYKLDQNKIESRLIKLYTKMVFNTT